MSLCRVLVGKSVERYKFSGFWKVLVSMDPNGSRVMGNGEVQKVGSRTWGFSFPFEVFSGWAIIHGGNKGLIVGLGIGENTKGVINQSCIEMVLWVVD
jgi:hypothetical protein